MNVLNDVESDTYSANHHTARITEADTNFVKMLDFQRNKFSSQN